MTGEAAVRRREPWPVACLALAVLTAAVLLPAPRAEATIRVAERPTWGTDGTVFATLLTGGRVYLGGAFTALVSPDGLTRLPRNHLAALDAATGEPIDWAPNPDGTVHALATDGTSLFVGGSFWTIGGQRRRGLAAFTPDGQVVSPWAATTDGTVMALVADGDRVYAGGMFTHVAGSSRPRLAAFSSAGVLLDWHPEADDRVLALTMSAGAVIAGGSFDAVDHDGGQEHLVRLHAGSGAILPWSSHPDAEVLGLATGPDEAVYAAIGGSGGTVAAWSSTGSSRWHMSLDGDAQAVAFHGGRVIAGGHWQYLDHDILLPRLAAFDPADGHVDTTWRPRPNKQIWALTSDGATLAVGGAFTSMGGAVRRRVALLA